jgi:hypothetical protein
MVVSSDEVLSALRDAGLESELLTYLHVTEIQVKTSRGQAYAIRFMPNGRATVSTLVDVHHRCLCDTVAEVLAEVQRETPR